MKKHPMQPIEWVDGVIRFRKNKIISDMYDAGLFNLNSLACLPYSDEDRMQLAQLLGYSVSGFGDLPYASREAIAKADKKANQMLTERAVEQFGEEFFEDHNRKTA